MIARLLGVTPSAVANWKQWWKEKGVEGLKAKPANPSRSRITKEQKAATGWVSGSGAESAARTLHSKCTMEQYPGENN
jgi:transposase